MGEPGPSQAASSTSQPSQPPISQAVAQLLSVLSNLTARLGDARAPVMSSHGQDSPTVIVVSIVISVPGYGYPMSIAMLNGGYGGLSPHLNGEWSSSPKPGVGGSNPPGAATNPVEANQFCV